MAAEGEIQPWSATEYGNLALVQEIKKHPCLYNNTIPEYSRKDITGKAWQEIADKFECSVPKMKTRWKNLRTAYFRGKKAQWKGGKHYQKPYYMDEYLRFLLPFTKSRKLMKQLASLCHDEEPVEDQTNDTSSDDPLESVPKKAKPTVVKLIGATVHPEVPETVPAPPSKENCSVADPQPFPLKDTPTFSISDSESFRTQFMMSVLPEIEEMPESKFRTFKRKILYLIDDIKAEE